MTGPLSTRAHAAPIHPLTTPLRPDERAKGLAAEASAWAKHAHAAGGLTPDAVTAKALDALALSLSAGFNRLVLPSKITGTKARKDAVLALAHSGAVAGTPLALTGGGELLAVSWGGRELGFLQGKHAPWARPLVPHGLTAGLLAVTGLDDPRKTPGVNLCLVGVGAALDRLHVGAAPAAGDGASGPPPTGPDDVRLHRDARGVARISVPVITRHGTGDVEWGHLAPAVFDCALSALAPFAPAREAERLHERFAAEVLTRVSYNGGVLRADRIRAWVARHAEGPAA